MNYTKDVVDSLHSQLADKFIFGHTQEIYFLLAAYICQGHVLIEGPPGTGKTLTAKLLSRFLGKNFQRIQFTTDMLPGDILGASIFDPNKREFEFIKGPIFSDFIIADEINRTPPRTQSALLEAMEEKQVTVEGKTHVLSEDFFVIATQNPQDFEGTFSLPEVQLDRFLFKIILSHADAETEQKMLLNILDGTLPPKFSEIKPLEFNKSQVASDLEKVKLSPSLLKYITDLIQETRSNPMISYGSSVRGGIALAKTSRAFALIQGRDYVTPDDIKTLAPLTLRHRIKLTPEAQVSNLSADAVLSEVISKLSFPA